MTQLGPNQLAWIKEKFGAQINPAQLLKRTKDDSDGKEKQIH